MLNQKQSENLRRLPRRTLFAGEGISVQLRRLQRSVPGEIIDLSAQGLGIVVTDASGFSLGDEIKVVHTSAPTARAQYFAEIRHMTRAPKRTNGTVHLGTALRAPSTARAIGAERRRTARFGCSPQYPIYAAAGSPVFFAESMAFAVRDVAANGFLLHGLQPYQGLFPGMQLELRVMLPITGTFHLRVRVAWVAPIRDAIALGVAFVEPSRPLLEAIAEQILVCEPDVTATELRERGFAVGTLDHAIVCDYATTPADLDAVARLRMIAHQHEGRLQGVTLDDMRSSFDDDARIVVCRRGNRIIGCARLIFVGRDPSRSQYVTWGNHVIPDHIWAVGFLEAGSGAMDPAYQRTGLFIRIVQHLMRVAAQADYRYVIGAADHDLWPMYAEMGAELLESRVVRPKEGWHFGWEFTSNLFLWDLEKLETAPPAGKFVDQMVAAIRFAKRARTVVSLDDREDLI